MTLMFSGADFYFYFFGFSNKTGEYACLNYSAAVSANWITSDFSGLVVINRFIAALFLFQVLLKRLKHWPLGGTVSFAVVNVCGIIFFFFFFFQTNGSIFIEPELK